MAAFTAALPGVPVAHAQTVDSTVARQAGFSPERLDRLQAMLESEVHAGRLGFGVGLVARDGQIVYLEAVGELAPDVPMFTDAIMRLASVGKGFTAHGLRPDESASRMGTTNAHYEEFHVLFTR